MRGLPIVDDFMDKSFATVKPSTGISEAVDLLIRKKLTGVLVVDEKEQLVGILSEKDCLKILLHSGFYRVPDDTVENYMHTELKTTESNMDIIAVAQIFMGCSFRRLPVVDDGKLVGQITRRDIVRGMQEYFKEVN